uniref:Uncharacterized protein n=1 Tax=viral metagenome TaxID=1070528 RepID=A0A6M3KHB5_9ZZZZ
MGNMFQIGDSVYIPVVHEVYTLSTNSWSESDADAGYPKITIISPDNVTKVDAQAMTKKATGKFEYEYTIPAAGQGEWTGFIDVLNSTKPNRQYFTFKVED